MDVRDAGSPPVTTPADGSPDSRGGEQAARPAGVALTLLRNGGLHAAFPPVLPPAVFILPSSEQRPLLSFCGSPLSLHSILNLRWKVKEKERASLEAQMVKNLPAMQEMRAQPLAQEEPLEEEMTTPPSILAWRGPWPGGPGGLQSSGSRAKSRFEGLHHWYMLTLCYSAGYAHGLF